MLGKFLLKRAIYRRYPQQIAPDETPIEKICEWLCNELSESIANITEGLQPNDVAAHFVCTTCIDRAFSGGLFDWKEMRKQIKKK